jgi:hypothetical protein
LDGKGNTERVKVVCEKGTARDNDAKVSLQEFPHLSAMVSTVNSEPGNSNFERAKLQEKISSEKMP